MDTCYECQQLMTLKQGTITVVKPGYGPYDIKAVLHLGCDNCGTKIVLPNETIRIEMEGIRLHMLKILKEKGPLEALNLKEELRSSTKLLEKVTYQLVKEKLITLDYTNNNAPVLAIYEDLSTRNFWQKFKNYMKLVFG